MRPRKQLGQQKNWRSKHSPVYLQKARQKANWIMNGAKLD